MQTVVINGTMSELEQCLYIALFAGIGMGIFLGLLLGCYTPNLTGFLRRWAIKQRRLLRLKRRATI